MAEQWIEAAAARALVAGSEWSHSSASRSICLRAHHGLIRSKAALFTNGGASVADFEVPPEFWWAGGEAALKQDWVAGDFGTWIKGRVELKAFGVTFDADGVLALVPAERRALAARSLSVVGNPAWATARDARLRVGNAGISSDVAWLTLLDHGRLGFVPARAALAESAGREVGPFVRREWDVPPEFWGRIETHQGVLPWERGAFAGSLPVAGYSRSLNLTGVHFQREALEAVFPIDEQAPEARGPKAATGGRPPAAFWDEMWCAVWGRVYRGDLKPLRLADVERAMLDWLASKGEAPSVSTVRVRAHQLLAELRKEDENP